MLLTPGPYNETYFEHAYLARYLGFTLVEGGDLTVRDRRVFLKTLDGLQPVDVILRRLDDSFCDPLELRGDSLLGVPAWSRRCAPATSTIANALGSGVIETPALPAVPARRCAGTCSARSCCCRRSPTWWCGQPDGAAVRARASRPAGRQAGVPVERARAGVRPQARATTRKRRSPRRCARGPTTSSAQEQVALSTAPVWHRHTAGAAAGRAADVRRGRRRLATR